jgi:hypothetical protein
LFGGERLHRSNQSFIPSLPGHSLYGLNRIGGSFSDAAHPLSAVSSHTNGVWSKPWGHDTFERMKICASVTCSITLVMAMMADADPVETPGQGSPLRRAVLDGLRASKPMQELSQVWHAKVVFTDVSIRRSGDWTWVTASPMSEKDDKNKTESISGVMRESHGQWTMVEFVSDSIAAADDPEKEFRVWRTDFMKKHPECPAAIFPAKF